MGDIAEADDRRSALGRAIVDSALSRATVARRAGELGFVLEIGRARVEGQIRQAGGDSDTPGLPLGSGWHLVYRVEGSLSAREQTEAKRRLEDVAVAIAAAVERCCRTVRTVDELGPALVDPDVREIHLVPELVEQPQRLVPAVEAAYGACIDRLVRPARVVGLPPCLGLTQRPRFPEAVGTFEAPSTGACSGCGARATCVANGGAGPNHREGLTALVHEADEAAAWACFESLDGCLLDRGSASSDVARSVLGDLLDLPHGPDGPPPTPMEFSLKVADDAVVPVLRFVQYPPSYDGHGAERTGLVAARREAIAEILGSHRFDVAAFHRWTETLVSAEGREVELSVGIDAADAGVRVQCYAHVGTSSPNAQLTTLQALLVHCDAPGDARQLVRDLVARRKLRVELVGWAARAGARSRLKLYFGIETHAEDAPSGLGLGRLGPLSAHAGKTGLAVLEVDSGGAEWVKRDYPVRTHFQRSPSVVDAFAGGMAESQRSLLDRLLGGRAFRPSPTWMSVSLRERGVRALYFVSR